MKKMVKKKKEKGKVKHLIRKLKHSPVFFLLVLTAWFIFRVGKKPSRVIYPCQQSFLAQVNHFVLPSLVASYSGFKISTKMSPTLKKSILVIGLFLVFAVGVVFLIDYVKERELYLYSDYKPSQSRLSPREPVFGPPIDFPNRVVSVRDSGASDWGFSSSCPSSGSCANYYGSDSYVDQAVIDNMVDEGLMELTNTTDIISAWNEILPNYQPGEGIAVKLNFNDAIYGEGVVGYGDDDSYVDAIPQPVNSIIRGMKSIGVQEQDIWLYDSSRYITDRFRAEIHYPNVKYYDGFGNGADVEQTGFTSTDPSAVVDFTPSGFPGARNITDILVYSTYLINMPIFKFHGGTAITLGLKNHYGSVDTSSNPIDMHDYFYLNRPLYNSNVNPLVDINANTNIKDKTVLVVGEGIYGCKPTNNGPPSEWDSFGVDSPNMMFFGVDPIATDSVMYDYLYREWETNYPITSGDIFQVAENAGLGIHERWDNDVDKQYATIDHVELSFNFVEASSNVIDGYWLMRAPVNSTNTNNGISYARRYGAEKGNSQDVGVLWRADTLDDDGKLLGDFNTDEERHCVIWAQFIFDDEPNVQSGKINHLYCRAWALSHNNSRYYFGRAEVYGTPSEMIMDDQSISWGKNASSYDLVVYDNSSFNWEFFNNDSFWNMGFSVADLGSPESNDLPLLTFPNQKGFCLVNSLGGVNISDPVALGVSDYDLDGLSDYTELYITFTDPTDVDTDDDTHSDYQEYMNGKDGFDPYDWGTLHKYNAATNGGNEFKIYALNHSFLSGPSVSSANSILDRELSISEYSTLAKYDGDYTGNYQVNLNTENNILGGAFQSAQYNLHLTINENPSEVIAVNTFLAGRILEPDPYTHLYDERGIDLYNVSGGDNLIFGGRKWPNLNMFMKGTRNPSEVIDSSGNLYYRFYYAFGDDYALNALLGLDFAEVWVLTGNTSITSEASLLNPLGASPLAQTTINFSFVEDDVNIIDGLSVNSIYVGGSECVLSSVPVYNVDHWEQDCTAPDISTGTYDLEIEAYTSSSEIINVIEPLAVYYGAGAPATAFIVDHTNYLNFDTLTQEQLDNARSLNWLWGHQSVGRIIMYGLEQWEVVDPVKYKIDIFPESGMLTDVTISEYVDNGPIFGHFNVGTFFDEVFNFLNTNPGIVDVVMMKYGYTNICETGCLHSTAQSAFDSYKAQVDSFRVAHPEVVIVHVPAPLKTSEDLSSVERALFHDMILLEYGGLPGEYILDLPDLESWYGGAYTTFNYLGTDYWKLEPSYTYDDGHPLYYGSAEPYNQAVLAKAMWVMMVRVAEDLGAQASACTDINSDGKVNIIDLALIVYNQGHNSGDLDWEDYLQLDLDGSGAVDAADISLVLGDFGGSGSGCGASTTYERQITLSPSTTISDYQIKVDLNPGNFDYSKVKSDGGDIRFYDLSMNSLDYWIEEWNPLGDSILWVEVASSGVSNIIMQYGDSLAESESNGTATFEFFDDFSGWTSYSGNPILSPVASTWEEKVVFDPIILKNIDGTPYKDANGYWMYYSGGQLDNGVVSLDQMGLAFSQDLYTWNKHPSNPVLAVSGTLGDYDYADVQLASVLKNDITWMAWYASNQLRYPTGESVTLSYATSSDGVNWDKYSGNPILIQEVGCDDNDDLYAPTILYDNGIWKMWYVGHSVSAEFYSLMYATAPNPEGPWTKQNGCNYVFEPGYNLWPYEVWKENGIYYLIFINYDVAPYRIRLATSPDGINWNEKGILYPEGLAGSWNDLSVMGHSQVFLNKEWYTFHHGWTTQGGSMDIGVETSSIPLPTTKNWDFLYNIGGSYNNELRFSGLSRTSNVEGYAIQKSYTPSERVAYTTKIRFDDNLLVGQRSYFHVFGNTFNKRFGFGISNVGNNLDYLDNTGWVDSGIDLVTGTNYELAIVYDPVSQTADYYYEGSLLQPGAAPFGSPTEMNKITYGSYLTGVKNNTYVDDLFVRKYSYPEPSVSVGGEIVL